METLAISEHRPRVVWHNPIFPLRTERRSRHRRDDIARAFALKRQMSETRNDLTTCRSPNSSTDEEGTTTVHVPGRGYMRTGDSSSRDIHKGNASRDLEVRARLPLHKPKKRENRKHDRKPGELVCAHSFGVDQLPAARDARSNLSLLSRFASGRRDPFNTYAHQDQPIYIHDIVDYLINEATEAYASSDKPGEFQVVRSQLMGEIMCDSLIWYTVITAAIVHRSFMQGHTKIPLNERLLRLSYYNKVIDLVNRDIKANSGIPSESGLLAIIGFVAANGASGTERPFLHDKVQARKAFGKANDMHYYSAQELDYTHWRMLAQFVRSRGGVSSLKLKVMAMVVASYDSLTAWSRLSKPLLDSMLPTATALMLAVQKADDVANSQARKMLSGLPVGFRTCPEVPYATLYEAMQHMRTIVVRFSQWQRRRERAWRPDLRQIHLTRILLMHDFLNLDSMETDGTGMPLTFEMCRHAAFAFMQLVLYPIARNNDMPNRLLKAILPLLQLAQTRLGEAAKARRGSVGLRERSMEGGVNAGLFIWLWILAGMLALEELQTKETSEWMDKVAPFLQDMPIKAEKSSWPQVKDMMETFLWLDSECDPQGQQWWNYACLWLQARVRDDGLMKTKSATELLA